MGESAFVELSFLIIAAKPRRRVADHQLRLVSRADPLGLHFVPRSHLFWSNDARTLGIGIWQECASEDDTSRWSASPTSTTWSTGHLRWRGRPWPAEGEWAKELVAATQNAQLPQVARDLAGIFTAGIADVDDRCTLVSDPLGYRLMYYGESDDVGVVSSGAALAARALAHAGTPPARDRLSTCWLAYSGYRVTDQSGFVGVRVVPPGSVVSVEAGAGVSFKRASAAWLPTPSQHSLSADELVELARSSIAESLRATVSLPCDRRVVGLTGGKDSRLILAVLWSEGLTHEFDFVTTGPPDLPDVQIASQLATRLGLRYVNDFPLTGPVRSYSERMRDFVKLTAGMLNIWDMKERGDQPNTEVRVTGLCGEILRSYRPLRSGLESRGELVRMYEPGKTFGRLALVRPEIAEEFHRFTLEALLDDPAMNSKPIDLLDTFHLKYRVRFSRVGPLEEFSDYLRVLPLYSIDAIRAAFALGGAARHAELLHFEIMRRCCPPLVDQPFTGPGWAQGRAQREGALARDESMPSETSAVSKAAPLMLRLQMAGFADRKQTLEEVFLDQTNPAWDVIDPNKALESLERFGELSGNERRELYGAATAGLWLGSDVRP